MSTKVLSRELIGNLRPFAAMLGSVAGVALQLQQPRLWDGWIYPAMVAARLVLLLFLGRSVSGHWRAPSLLVPVLLAAGLCGAGLAGWRAHSFLDNALPATVEGRDVRVTGVVAAMPQ